MVGLRGSTHGIRSRTTTEHDASLLDAITHDMIQDADIMLLDLLWYSITEHDTSGGGYEYALRLEYSW